MAEVACTGLGKTYTNGVAAVSGVSLTVGDGELLAVVGPSGSGKSTLLRLIAGLEEATAGTLTIGSRDVTKLAPRARDVAMVFQHPALFPHLSVFDNLAFGLKARGASRALVREQVAAAAGTLGLDQILKGKPNTLSGGQRQRVALGRAMVRRPGAFLLDEPLSALDAPLRANLRAEIRALHKTLAATMIFVTHDQSEALALGQRVAVMERGRIVQIGSPRDVYERPATRFVATFLGSPPMNLLPCRIDHGNTGFRLNLEGDDQARMIPTSVDQDQLIRLCGRELELGIRPEHVRLSSEPSDESLTWITGTSIEGTEFLGHETVVSLRAGNYSISTYRGSCEINQPRGPLAVGLDLRHASWFDRETGQSMT